MMLKSLRRGSVRCPQSWPRRCLASPPARPPPSLIEAAGRVHACMDQNLRLLEQISTEDFKKQHDGVLMGSVQFKGSVAEQLFKTIRPLSLITESYKHAICSNSPTVLLDSTKPHVTPIDEADRDEVKEFTSALKHDLSRLLLDEAAMDMDVLVRFPPRDPGGIEFDVQSNLRRELHYVTKNYKHYFSIVTALLYHMSVDFESTAK